ncbi:hypothetical protein [Burkholderia sp. IMCC1007]|uniref:hypothetical protein n=1 Tax=Burkholderia sp. IMCC1007 TaxID=3004104 RepID=UPI0022B535CE|nr:hypothetical protein [Burkholderia sp. IMCC1007]
MNRSIGKVVYTTIMHALMQLIGGAVAQVLNAFACIAPARASSPARAAAREAGRHDAGLA